MPSVACGTSSRVLDPWLLPSGVRRIASTRAGGPARRRAAAATRRRRRTMSPPSEDRRDRCDADATIASARAAIRTTAASAAAAARLRRAARPGAGRPGAPPSRRCSRRLRELGEAGLELVGEGGHGREAVARGPSRAPSRPRPRAAARTSGRSSVTRRRRRVDVLHRDGDEVLAGERHLAGQQLVEDDPERVDVGALVDLACPAPARARCSRRCRAPCRSASRRPAPRAGGRCRSR